MEPVNIMLIGGGIKKLFCAMVPDEYRSEFKQDTFKTNLFRAKLTAAGFMVIETILLVVLALTTREELGSVPNVYYVSAYIFMVLLMAAFLILFSRMEKTDNHSEKTMSATEFSFTSIILLRSAFMSLFDQMRDGQVGVYIAALFAIAVVPYIRPVVSLIIYAGVHLVFLSSLPYFFHPAEKLPGVAISTSAYVALAWIISRTMYKSRVTNFISNKTIQKNNRELQEANQKLETLSFTDSLTGVYNRRKFYQLLRMEWKRGTDQCMPLSIIMVDIDHFKLYNDNYGHRSGDHCIREIGKLLASFIKRSSDMVARYGGDEFVIVLPCTGDKGACTIAENIRSAVEGLNIPHAFSPVSDHVTISLGVYTVVPSDDSSLKSFIEAADKALYRAKQADRNRVYCAVGDN